MSSRNLYQILVDTASRHPTAPAVEYGTESIDYKTFLGKVDELRAKLITCGVKPGDRVAVMAPRDMNEPALLFALSGCRAVFASLNRLWKPAQVSYAIRYLQPHFFISSGAILGELHNTGGALAPITTLLSWEAVAAATPVACLDPCYQAAALTDLAAIIFTSGSSGFPKGVMHTNAGLLRWTESTVRYLANRPGDRILAILPLAFGYGLNQLICMVYCGGCYRIAASVLMPDVITELADQPITGLAGIPGFWRDFTQMVPRLKIDPAHFSLRYVTNAGGHCPAAILSAVRQQIQASDVVLMYGTTETLRSAYLPPHLFESKMGALGVAVPGAEVLLLNKQGTRCQPGEIGEIVHRGPTVAQGYFGTEGQVNDRFRSAPEWLEPEPNEKVCFTGDLARVDDDGILWFESRADRQIKISGFRISPSEIEEVVREMTFVDEAIAVAVKTPARADSIHLAIAVKNDHIPPKEEDVTRFLRQRIANYMVPSKVHFWREPFPRTANGKTDYATIQRVLGGNAKIKKTA